MSFKVISRKYGRVIPEGHTPDEHAIIAQAELVKAQMMSKGLPVEGKKIKVKWAGGHRYFELDEVYATAHNPKLRDWVEVREAMVREAPLSQVRQRTFYKRFVGIEVCITSAGEKKTGTVIKVC